MYAAAAAAAGAIGDAKLPNPPNPPNPWDVIPNPPSGVWDLWNDMLNEALAAAWRAAKDCAEADEL